jgi:CBS domain-containing protein
MRCRDLMKRPLVTCLPTDTVRWCAQLMKDWNIGFVPVVDEDGRLVGVVTDRDLTLRVLADGAPKTTLVGDVMSKNLVTVHPDSDFVTAEETLSASKKSRVPLVDEEGVCRGVISLSDIAQAESRRRAAKVFRDVTRRETAATHLAAH